MYRCYISAIMPRHLWGVSPYRNKELPLLNIDLSSPDTETSRMQGAVHVGAANASQSEQIGVSCGYAAHWGLLLSTEPFFTGCQ